MAGTINSGELELQYRQGITPLAKPNQVFCPELATKPTSIVSRAFPKQEDYRTTDWFRRRGSSVVDYADKRCASGNDNGKGCRCQV